MIVVIFVFLMNILSIARRTSGNLEWLKGIGVPLLFLVVVVVEVVVMEVVEVAVALCVWDLGFWGLGFSLMHVGFEDLGKMMQTYFGVVERFCRHISEHYLLANLDRFRRSKDDTCRNFQ